MNYMALKLDERRHVITFTIIALLICTSLVHILSDSYSNGQEPNSGWNIEKKQTIVLIIQYTSLQR